MKIKDLQNIVYDTVYVYKENLQEVNGHWEMFQDLYKGKLENTPENILNMEIKTIGAMKTRIVDIKVK